MQYLDLVVFCMKFSIFVWNNIAVAVSWRVLLQLVSQGPVFTRQWDQDMCSARRHASGDQGREGG